MSTDEYVPHEDDVRAAWVGRLGTDTPLFTDEAGVEFDRFLARVHRDAKTEALIDAAEDLFYDGDIDRPMYGHRELYNRADRIKKGNSNE